MKTVIGKPGWTIGDLEVVGEVILKRILTFCNLTFVLNLLNAELNPIRHLLALVGARHIVHVSRIRVNRIQILSSYLTENRVYVH